MLKGVKMVSESTRQRGCLGPDVKKIANLLYRYKFFQENKQKKFTTEPKSYTAMLLYLFFDYSLSTCPKKMETEKWPKAADSPLNIFSLVHNFLYINHLRENTCLKYRFLI